jgi:hypothetical protein
MKKAPSKDTNLMLWPTTAQIKSNPKRPMSLLDLVIVPSYQDSLLDNHLAASVLSVLQLSSKDADSAGVAAVGSALVDAGALSSGTACRQG